jgi:hypothetical protein
MNVIRTHARLLHEYECSIFSFNCSNIVTLTFYLSNIQSCVAAAGGPTTCVSATPTDFSFPTATVAGFQFIIASCAIACVCGGLGLVVSILILLNERKVLSISVPLMGRLIGFSWVALGFALAALITWGAVVFPYLLILSIIGNLLRSLTTVNLAGLGLLAACLL